MKIWKLVVPLICVLCCATLPLAASAENEEAEADQSMLRAAIFVQNRAGEKYDDKVDVLNDMITTRLTGKGFSIIDKQVVVEKFREARDENAEMKETIEALTDGAIDFSVEDALKEASALRLAQMIGADYIIVATINSVGHTAKKFKGKGTIYGVDNEVTDYTLRVALKVLEAGQGGSVYGDVVKATERIAQTDNLEIVSSDIINNLLEEAALGVADNIGGRVDEIRMAKVKHSGGVPFTIITNGIDAATVELDGAAIGSTGTEPVEFVAPPGIHMMRITRQWCETWERPVNIYADQKLNVTLQLSAAGIEKFKDLEGFKTEMAIAREQSDAEAYATKAIATGEQKKREESYIRLDTSNAEKISIGDNTPRVIVEEEVE
jgi:PEGA domain